MRNKTIQYGIDLEMGTVLSRFGNMVASPVIDFEGMNPKNQFEIGYILEKFSVYDTVGMRIKWTRKIPNEIKNKHRKFWGMKKLLK